MSVGVLANEIPNNILPGHIKNKVYALSLLHVLSLQ